MPAFFYFFGLDSFLSDGYFGLARQMQVPLPFSHDDAWDVHNSKRRKGI